MSDTWSATPTAATTTMMMMSEREARKAAKRVAKEARAARAIDPFHAASKADMIQKAEWYEQSVRDADAARAASAESFRTWCRRRCMDEVDTDGEEY